MGNQFSQPLKKTLAADTLPNLPLFLKQPPHRQCPTYGPLHMVPYNSPHLQVQLQVTEPQAHPQTPDPLSLHHLILPNLYLIPPHLLLQCYKIDRYEGKRKLLQFMYEICQLGDMVDIGLSRNRVAYSYGVGRWCVMGDIGNGLWNYQKVIKDGGSAGVYFSPQLMSAFSSDKLYPKIPQKKSDTFIFAVMLLQILSQQNLQAQVYNFATCEMQLGPLLQALIGIEEMYGKDVYQLLVKMLELDPEDRLDFGAVMREVVRIGGNLDGCCLSPIYCKGNSLTPPPNVKPKVDSYQPSPQITKVLDQSRGRSPGAIRKNLPFPDRQNPKKSFSPIKNAPSQISIQTQQKHPLLPQDRNRRFSNGNNYKITPTRIKIWEGMEKQRPKVQPFGLRFQYGGGQGQGGLGTQEGASRTEKKSFSKLKNIRY